MIHFKRHAPGLFCPVCHAAPEEPCRIGKISRI